VIRAEKGEKVSFTRLLDNPELAQRYHKVKQFFYMKESAYDVTSVCQLRCDGCYYFEGAKSLVRDNRDPEAWRAFFEDEKRRGITYVVLAGAEPSLVPAILQACYDVIPFGSIASNGLRPIDTAVRYRIHLSVWGDSTGDPVYRKYAGGQPGPDCLSAQLKNYRDDERAIFVYTFNGLNVDQVDEVARRVTGEGHSLTFNLFSAPNASNSGLRLNDALRRTRDKMVEVMVRYNGVLYSHYNAAIHTHPKSLHHLFGCIYPRAQMTATQVQGGLGDTFRSYRADLTHAREYDCCVPDTDCADCRHYAAGSAIVSSQLFSHSVSEQSFRAWLDYVDTYLAVWVLGYQRGENLYTGTGEELLPAVPLRTSAAVSDTLLRVL
jgi:hypothetical protein